MVLVLALSVGAGAALQAEAAPKKKHQHKLIRVCHRGERSHRKNPCVRAPHGVSRPRGRKQQGGPNNVLPAPTTGGLGGGGFNREESAIAWSRGLLHDGHYAWRCERFVENAYNVTDKFDTAALAEEHLQLHKGRQPPRGALVYFRPDKLNRGLGHVGIAVDKNNMISALDTVEISNFNDDEYWHDRYLGWTDAPDDWGGRFIIPDAPDAGLQQPPDNSQPTTTPGSGTPNPTTTPPAPTVQLTSPAAGQTLTGTVTLGAKATNASGVEFDAYYASTPSNVNTLSWHKLGSANTSGDGNWTMPYDTHAIPDQGDAAVGSVNIVAVVLDSTGAQTQVRDYHRVNVSNPVAPPPPPPPPAYYVHHIYNTCADGQCGLNKRAGPGYSNYAKVGGLYDGNEADVACQTTGETVSSSKFGSTTIWDKLTDGSYVTDLYVDTPGAGAFSPPIPHC
jgi:hypothetical protein